MKHKWYLVDYKSNIRCWNCDTAFDLDQLPKPVRACPNCGHTSADENAFRAQPPAFPRNAEGVLDFTTLGGMTPAYVPAVVKEESFRALTENIIKGLKQARADMDQPIPLREILIVFRRVENELYGVLANVMMEIAETASDQVIEFQLDGRHNNITLRHGDTRQRLLLRHDGIEDDNKERIVKAFTVFAFGHPPEKIKLDKWIKKAVAKNGWHWGTFGFDLHRIHYQDALPFNQDASHQIPEVTLQKILDWLAEAREFKNYVTLSPAELESAVKIARAGDKSTIRMQFLRSGLAVAGISEEFGKFEAELEGVYEFSGTPKTIYINPKFLLDALSGMRKVDTITLRYDEKGFRAYLTDGVREALIMLKYAPVKKKGKKK